jgi:hypothetical protein
MSILTTWVVSDLPCVLKTECEDPNTNAVSPRTRLTRWFGKTSCI